MSSTAQVLLASHERHKLIADLLAKAASRMLQTPQKLPSPPQDCLASSPETLLSVSTTVNTTGEQGEHE